MELTTYKDYSSFEKRQKITCALEINFGLSHRNVVRPNPTYDPHFLTFFVDLLGWKLLISFPTHVIDV